MVGSEGQAHRVGHEQAHEPDDPRDRHGGGRRDRARRDHRQLQRLDGEAELRRRTLAQLQDVERARVGDQRGARDRDGRRDGGDARPRRERQASQQPRQHARSLLARRQKHERRRGRQQRADDDTGQDQRHDRQRPAAARDGHHHRHRSRRAEERRGGYPERGAAAQCAAADDREGRREPGAAGGAQEVRIGQRVAEDRLVRHPREGQRRPDQGGQGHARQTDLPHDAIDDAGLGGRLRRPAGIEPHRPGDGPARAPPDGGDHLPRRDRDAPEPGRQDHDERQGRDRDHQRRGQPSAAGHPPGTQRRDAQNAPGWNQRANSRAASPRRGPARLSTSPCSAVTSITRPERTAAIPAQPGRARSAARSTP